MAEFDKEVMMAKVDKALDDVRPHLKVDGGNVEVVDVNEKGEVKIKWLGNCENCSMSAMTMRAGVEEAIKSKLPSIQTVKAINGAFQAS